MGNFDTKTPHRGRATAIGLGIVTIVLALSAIIFGGKLIETVDAGEIKVIQYPNGTMKVMTDPGWTTQWFGDVTTYPKRGHYDFDGKSIGPGEGAGITFNDGAVSAISGSIQFNYPLTEKEILEIHTQYGSHEAFSTQLVQVVVDKAIFVTGPLLSSKESYAERRPELIRWVEDQISNGVYDTVTVQVQEEDALGAVRTKSVATIRVNDDGTYARIQGDQFEEFGVRARNFAITDVLYDATVTAQIKTQQGNLMAVETAIAEAKEAEQRTKTVEQQGRATAASAKWKQEALRATAVTLAEQKRDVAKLDREAAAEEKAAAILRGEGEARARQLVMTADGALKLKLDTYERVMGKFAEHFGNLPVAQVNMGGSGVTGERAADLIDLLTAKTAQDLALNVKPDGKQ